MGVNQGPEKRKKIEIVVDRVEKLRSKDTITKVEFDQSALLAVGNFFADNIVENPTALMILMSPPGQSGETRYVDTVVDLPDSLTRGDNDFAYYVKTHVNTQPGLESHVVTGFASVYPVKDKLQNAFDTGFDIWATLGHSLITEPSEILETDFGSMTIWSKREDGQIRPIDVVVLPDIHT